MFKKYFKIWWMMSRNSFSAVLGQKLALSMFLVGKIFRFIFFFLFLYFLLKGTGSLAGYSGNQSGIAGSPKIAYKMPFLSASTRGI